MLWRSYENWKNHIDTSVIPFKQELNGAPYFLNNKSSLSTNTHDDVIKWKHFPRHWSFVRGIHRSPVNSPHKGPVTRSFDVFVDLCLNKPLGKPSRRRWFETPSCSLWRHCNDQRIMQYFIPTSTSTDVCVTVAVLKHGWIFAPASNHKDV